MERRDFLVGTAATVTNAGKLKGEMLHRELGKTGVEVSATGLGGEVPEAEKLAPAA